MKRNIIYTAILLMVCQCSGFAQSWGDYTLIARQNSTTVSLINLSNTAVKTWSLSGSTGYSAYLLPGGDLLRSVTNTGNSLSGGGMTGRIQKVSYSGTVLWDYVYSSSTYCMHHDICPMPNGNVLIISYDVKTASEVAAAGGTFGSTMWSEKIVELQPSGTNGANIVWEWKLWDHLAQNTDASKPNYVSSIVNNPQLMNVNYNAQKDWVHMNGIDYNSSTDQIVVSSHNLNEMWLIDHSTTTAEAASHSGGNSGKGGDFLYRWGNPAAYSASGSAVFNVVHDAHWVHDGPYTGYFAAFNNKGVSSSQSSIDYVSPNYNLTLGQAYLPSTYSARQAVNGYTSNMGNSQQLPNGNTLICVATAGNVYEINSAGTVVWSYNTGGVTPQARRYEASYLCASPPSASASASQSSICANTSITLNANASGSGLTYAWASNPTGFTSTSASASVTPTATTTYTVTVTSGTCSTTSSVVVTVNTKPTATITASPSASICSGNNVTLNTTASGGTGLTYSWSGNSLSSTQQNPTFAPTSTGTYTVTVTNSAGCSTTATQSITVNPLPTVSPSVQNSQLCQGASTTLNANAAGASNYTYNWSASPSASIASSASPNVNPSASTTYTVTVTSNGCTATGSTSVVVNPLPVANAGADVTVNAGNATTLTASGGTSYSWSNGTNSANNVVTPATTTTYTVTVTDINGCTATDQVVVSVLSLSATASAAPTTICSGNSTQLNVTSTGGTGTSTYQWASSDGLFSSTVQNPTVSPALNTTYYVTVTNGTLTAISNVQITVNTKPQVSASASSNTICAGNAIQISASVSNISSGNSFSWSNGTSVFSTAQNTSVSPSNTTTYSVTATNNGCASTASTTVTVNPLPSANAGADVTIYKGESSNLTAVGGGTYTWSNGTSGAINAVSPSVTTTYTVTVTDANGCSNTDAVVVSVKVMTITASASNSVICSGKSATLSVSIVNNANANSTYIWKDNNTSFSATTSNPTVSPTTTTIYYVTVTNGTQTATSSVQVNVNATPSVTVSTANPTLCSGNSTQLLTTVSGSTGHTYTWSDGGSFSSTAASPTVAPTTNTTYNVTVNNNGCTASASVSIIVKNTPQITLNASSTELCAGKGVDFSTTVANGSNYTYTWSSVPSGFSAAIANPSFSPTVSTTFSVSVESNGCSAASIKTINVNPLPSANAGVDVTINQGESTVLTASGGTQYLWNTGENTASITVKPLLTSSYKVTVTNNKGCTATDEVVVNIVGGILYTNITTPKSAICLGDSTTLNVNVSGGSGTNTFSWSNDDGFSSNTPQISVSPTKTTNYYVTVNSGAQSSKDTMTIIVNPLPIAYAGKDTTIVKGQQVHFTATGGDSYLWNTGDNTASITNTPANTKTYTVTVTNLAGCSSTAFVKATVSVLSVTIVANLPQKVCSGSKIQLDAITYGNIGAVTYAWGSAPTGFASTLKNPTVTPSETTTYWLTVTNGGIDAVSSVTINVHPLPPTPTISQSNDTLISSAVSGNQWFLGATLLQNDTNQVYVPKSNGTYQVRTTDTYGCSSLLSTPFNYIKTATNDALGSLSSVRLAPNPTSNEFRIIGLDKIMTDFEVILYNEQGQILQKQHNTTHFDVSQYTSQVLFVKVVTADKETYVSRLILQH